MRRFFPAFVVLFFLLPCALWGNSDSLLKVLEATIRERSAILAEKNRQFQVVRENLWEYRDDPDKTFEFQYELCSLYQSFSYDSASVAVQKLVRLARQTGNKAYMARAGIKQAFILLSAGIFQEALDSLEAIRAAGLPADVKASYFHTRARGYLDLAAYCLDRYYQPLYNAKGMAFLDSAIYYAQTDTLYYWSLSGLKALKSGEFEAGTAIYAQLLKHPGLSTRQLAIEATSAGDIYQMRGQESEAIAHLMLGAIADERSCVKESNALMKVATYLFEKEDYERANRFINLALEDAQFFGARLRKMQIVEILPLINARQLSLDQEKRKNLQWFSVILGLMLLLGVRLIALSLKQNRVLKKKEQTISDSFHQLEEYARALAESDHIKEKYIGYFFQSNAKLIDKIEGVIKNAQKSLNEGKPGDAKFHLDQFKASNEQKKLLRDFDRSFLSVFPNFVEKFNQLFEEKNRVALEEDQLLNTELRIFALIRLGITNNEVIAKALHYSVNTIYTYKTKVRNRSILPSEAFDEAVMKISAVENDP
jgi:Domain of unknown function (DUF6377)